MVVEALARSNPALDCEIVQIRTSGDWRPEQGENRLCEQQGGKGLFIKEIEAALLDGAIDGAVHSLKDVPSFLPEGMAVDHVLPRADARDALLSFKAQSIESLPEGAVIGTSSLRRQAFILHRRPDLKIVPLRGNVHTRLEKLKNGQVDAAFLAMAGLTRLDIEGDFIHPLSVDTILPACGQGIVGIETRLDDVRTRDCLAAIHDVGAGLCAAAERAALQALDGSCHTPIAAYATLKGPVLSLVVAVGTPDGAHVWEEGGTQPVASDEDARVMGEMLAEKLKRVLPAGALA